MFLTFVDIFAGSVVFVESISFGTGTFVRAGQVGAAVLTAQFVVTFVYI